MSLKSNAAESATKGIIQRCFGKYEEQGCGVNPLESGAAYRNRTDT
jgi:hypothetical protein